MDTIGPLSRRETLRSPPLRTRVYKKLRNTMLVFSAGGVFHKFFFDDLSRGIGNAVEWVMLLAGN